MKKRLLGIILVLCLMLTLLPLQALAEPAVCSGSIGDNISWTLDTEGTLTLSGEGEMAAVSDAGWSSAEVKRLVIGEGITSVSDGAFKSFKSMSALLLPESLKSIGASAFLYCQALTEVTLPGGIESIGSNAFAYCTKLKTVRLCSGIESIPAQCFFNCTALSEAELPDTVTDIGYFAFGFCTSLESIALPSRLYSIGQNAFSNCSALTEITIPESVKELGGYAFYCCTKLAEVSYGGSFGSVGKSAFSQTPFADRCKTASDGALYLGGWLIASAATDKLVLPEGTVGIAGGAMQSYSTKTLKELHLPASLVSIDSSLGKITDIYYYGSFSSWMNCGFKDYVNFNVSTVHFMGEGGHEHDYSYATETKEPDCYSGGCTVHTCVCGASYRDGVVPEKHSFGEWKTVTEMTCFNDGEESRQCQLCGKVETRAVPSSGHQYEEHVCTVCGWRECTFTDIANSGYRVYIENAVGLGIIAGYPDNTFRPNNSVTRGQFVTFLYRLAGEPVCFSLKSFPDVSRSSPYYKAIVWAAQNNITAGYSDGTFKPDKVITRAEMSTFAFRFLIDDSKVDADAAAELYAPVGFTDESSIAAPFKNPVNAMANLGVVSGFADGSFRPNQTASRGQAAAIIMRVYSLLASLEE